MKNADTLTKFMDGEYQVLTVSILGDVAYECGISYDEVVRYVQNCRSKGLDVAQCVKDLVILYRSDLIEKLK